MFRNVVNVPTLYVEPISPNRLQPVPFYRQTIGDLLGKLIECGWRVDASGPDGVVFVCKDSDVLALWTPEAMNARTATRVHIGIDLDFEPDTDWGSEEPRTEWVRMV